MPVFGWVVACAGVLWACVVARVGMRSRVCVCVCVCARNLAQSMHRFLAIGTCALLMFAQLALQAHMCRHRFSHSPSCARPAKP